MLNHMLNDYMLHYKRVSIYMACNMISKVFKRVIWLKTTLKKNGAINFKI